ncbi:MAG: hypothetical protein Q3X95_06245, partial [Duodenibacillus sp.]|nr:hypothetical protein [Duodenibacillus sp.]
MLLDRLQALLVRFYSKNVAADKAEIAHLSAPGTRSFTSSATGSNWETVSPVDGFVTVYSPGPGDTGTRELKIYSTPEASAPQIGFVVANTAGSAVFAPVRKGQGVKVWGANLDLSAASIRWFAFVGGGVKQLFRMEAAYA